MAIQSCGMSQSTRFLHTQARKEVVNTHVTKPIMPHGEWFHTHECEDLCRNRITMRADLHAIPNIRMPALGVAGELCASLLATQHVFEKRKRAAHLNIIPVVARGTEVTFRAAYFVILAAMVIGVLIYLYAIFSADISQRFESCAHIDSGAAWLNLRKRANGGGNFMPG